MTALSLRVNKLRALFFRMGAVQVTEISNDTALTHDSATALVTEHAVKGYVDSVSEITVVEEVITIPLSFETGEQTATKIYFPYKVTVNKIRSIVMKALAATDAGTITGANSTGDSSGGVVTVAASAALNEEDSATPTTNNVVEADSYYKLTTAKTTAGGKVLVTLEVTRTA